MDIKKLVKEIRTIRNTSAGHSFKRRHAERYRGCRKWGVGSHGGK